MSEISNVLREHSFFWRNIKKEIIRRDKYISKLYPNLVGNKEVLVILGARRVGKTYLMYSLIQDLIQQEKIPPDQILYCSVNDPRLAEATLDQIITEFRTMHRLGFDEKIYIFLDEIQHILNWDQELLKYREFQNVKLIVSGSSSLLIKNQSTFLTGRQLRFTIYPLDFAEFLIFKNYDPNPLESYLLQQYLLEFMEIGGFPTQTLQNDTTYLRDLLDAVLFKDIVSVYNINQPQALIDILRILAKNLGTRSSLHKIAQVLKTISHPTVKQYVTYLQEVYQILECNRFSFSTSEQLTSQKKYYFSDLGIRSTLVGGLQDRGALAENLLFLYLIERFGEGNVSYFYHENSEVDFIVSHKGKILAFESKFVDEIEPNDSRLKGIPKLIQTYPKQVESIYVVTNSYEHSSEIQTLPLTFIPLYKLLLKTEI